MNSRSIKVRIVQLVVSEDIVSNRKKVLNELVKCSENEWIVFPEAMLSGYYPDKEAYTSELDANLIRRYLEEIEAKVREVRCHCLLGSATFTGSVWHNSVHIFSHTAPACRHDKLKLSALDKRHFHPGETCSCHRIQDITFGVLACRELIFPDMWSVLKSKGAQIIFHINNAIQPQDALWRHLLIARAIENSVFVVSVNNAAAPQSLPSFVISPAGEIIAETEIRQEQSPKAIIDLNAIIADLNAREDY